MDELYNKLKEFGEVKINESLAKHATFKIGGPAKLFVVVSKTDKLVGLLNYLNAEGFDYFILAGGSNLLLSDEGFDGIVIKIATTTPPKITADGLGFEIEVEAGVMLSAVVNLGAKNGLTGIDWGIGIPGTFGGAIRGNAGAMGKEIARVLKWVEVWRNGEVARLKPEECGFSYRNSSFKHNKDIVLRGAIYLEPGDKQEILERMQKYLQQRKHTPYPSAGSFFKNIKLAQWAQDTKNLPELFLQRGTVPVGWITEQMALRGLSVGGAKISDEHGNYLINFNKATQSDVLDLVEQIKQKVYNRYGVELEPEVQIVK
ncbi:MAG: UDP-N-acetylmuramate dehydrogenase [Candidatus Magasanikbacteria bacterium]|nr:UDP-N-acetylmuramate dehydrogenase [Candidatus Magasanikbacteria bacterium]